VAVLVSVRVKVCEGVFVDVTVEVTDGVGGGCVRVGVLLGRGGGTYVRVGVKVGLGVGVMVLVFVGGAVSVVVADDDGDTVGEGVIVSISATTVEVAGFGRGVEGVGQFSPGLEIWLENGVPIGYTVASRRISSISWVETGL